MVRRTAIAFAVVGLAACGGDDGFTALDSERLAGVIDDALTEESGLKGLITADDLEPETIDEINILASNACDDLSDGFSRTDFVDFENGVLGPAPGLEQVIKPTVMVQSLVAATCPQYLDDLNAVIDE